MIVVSILLAFGIDAMWTRAQERRDEVAHLTTLREEAESNLVSLGRNVRILERQLADLERAVAILDSGLQVDSAAAFILSLASGSIFGRPSVSTAAFDDLTNSGGIRVIQNGEVRRRAFLLHSRIEATYDRWSSASDDIDAKLYSVIARHLPPGLVQRQRSGTDATLNEDAVTGAEMRSVAAAIASDAALLPEVRAEMQERLQQLSYLQFLREEVEKARELLLEVT